MKELRGRNALITGASRGIGVHIARALAGAGMNIALVARSGDAIEQLARELSSVGVRASAIVADLTDLTGLDRVLARAEAELGPLDVLINNAGVEGVRVFSEESAAQTEQMMHLNLLVPVLLARKSVPGMLLRKRGHIVNIASLAGKTAAPYCVSYATAKGGLVAFTHSLRGELRGSGVSASVVCPGFVSDEGMFAVSTRATPVTVSKLVGTSTPAQVADAVVFALRRDRAEVLVNPGPVRLFQALHQLAPDMVAWLQARMGVKLMMRTLALAASREAADGRPTPEPGQTPAHDA